MSSEINRLIELEFDKRGKLVWNKRIWTRDSDDMRGGPMSSMHASILTDDEIKWVKGELMFRDCNTAISYQHWVEGKQRHVDKARKNLYKIRDMLDSYIDEFEKACEELGDLDKSDK